MTMAELPKQRILIIEDDADLAVELEHFLCHEGFVVERARNGEAGLALAKKSAPDLIFLDLTLPKLSGFDVCESVRADERLQKTPVIVISGRASPIVRAQAADCGADGYLSKPFSREKLLAEIARVLGQPPGAEVLMRSDQASLGFVAAIDTVLRAAKIRRV
jgi:two-component system, OmpR family, phosphate regulon response regulator PhoB